jgi:ATP-dependent DNA helicase RecG
MNEMNEFLNTPLEAAFRMLKLPQKRALAKLSIKTIGDLLYHFPHRYEAAGDSKKISALQNGDEVTLFGTLSHLKTKKGFRTKIPMAEGRLSDETGTLTLIWFNQAFIGKTFSEKDLVKVYGSVRQNKRGFYISNPHIEKIPREDLPEENLFEKNTRGKQFIPSYPEARGITSRWFFHAIEKVLRLEGFSSLSDFMPKHVLKKYNLPDLKTAFIWMHAPKEKNNFIAAQKRFAFDEVFLIQLKRHKERAEYHRNLAYPIPVHEDSIESFLKRFSFALTDAQKRALVEVLDDTKKHFPMMRLIEGDVGSGKTAVAATTVYNIISTRPPNQDFGNLQAAYMAPTEILARQHFESFISYFKNLPIQIGFISGSECRKFPSKTDPAGHTKISRSQLLKWVGNGEVPILIGTHALIQDKVKFKHLALVIIDEQHRFGVKQRARFAKKEGSYAPHLLSMTATPIPRTLALTIYGDLDVSIVDELPPGRKPVTTKFVARNDREKTYEEVRKKIREGRQVYVICPRIDEPDEKKLNALIAKSVKEEAKRLQKNVFPEFSVGLLHGKMKPAEKEDAMKKFAEGKTQILVATSVVEVGVNVPNATIIIIEGAEWFGLAQLHQLRGRVLRSTHEPYCYLFSDSASPETKGRLKALITAKNGFELAELDLSLRGEGSLTGIKQWGLSDIGMEGIKNLKMVQAARNEAEELINKNTLKNYPELLTRVEKVESIHFE